MKTQIDLTRWECWFKDFKLGKLSKEQLAKIKS